MTTEMALTNKIDDINYQVISSVKKQLHNLEIFSEKALPS